MSGMDHPRAGDAPTEVPEERPAEGGSRDAELAEREGGAHAEQLGPQANLRPGDLDEDAPTRD
jgi:hypothetical protein